MCIFFLPYFVDFQHFMLYFRGVNQTIISTMFDFSPFSTFGVGGARRPSASCSAAAGHLLGELRRLSVPSSQVLTSCGSGAPALVRAAFPGCRVFSASQFSGLGRRAFAARAALMVRSLAALESPLWVCFPLVACPSGVAPSRTWVSCGSGSWSECSMAAGLGCSVLIFLPSGVVPPRSFGSWSPVSAFPIAIGRGAWWFRPAQAPQASLF